MSTRRARGRDSLNPRPSVAPLALASAILWGTALLLSAPAWGQEEGLPDPAEVMRQRGQRLLARLREGKPVRAVIFGDSLTAGWGTDGRHVYWRIVADALQYAFPSSRIEFIAHGHPGQTSEDGLRALDAEVIAARPDLVVVQFGGNDKGWGRRVEDYRRDLGELLRLVTTQTEALVIACTPPIVDPNPANPWDEAARAAITAEGAPVADLDRAIRQGDADYRGAFPYGAHPDSFAHAIMAREVLRALRDGVGLKPTFACRMVGGSGVSAQSAYDLEVEVSSLSDAPLECALEFEWQDQLTSDAVKLAPRQVARLKRTLALPAFAGQSRGYPVRLFARGGGFGDFDVRWLTVAPAARADRAEAPTWHDLPDDSFTIGRRLWLGPRDLAVRWAVAATPDRLRFVVEVTDNDITIAKLDDPSQGDSAELYLDLRSAAEQGKPIYSPLVVALQVIPPSREGDRAQWRAMQPLPDPLQAIAIDYSRAASGYRVQMDLPLAAIVASRGEAWQGLGFDIGVNDADFGGVRKSQLMWTGFPDNYLSPAYLAGLYLDELPPGAMRQTLR